MTEDLVPVRVDEATLGEAWIAIASAILTGGDVGSWDGLPILEVFQATLDVHSPRVDDPIIARHGDPERLAWMHANFTDHSRVAELGDSDSYATRLYDYAHAGHDQIRWVIDRLAANPWTRDATITTFQPLTDTSYVPCVSLLDFWLVKGNLQLAAYAHAIDFGTKGYGNLVQLTALQARVASDLGVGVGTLTMTVKSAHIYQTDLGLMRRIIAAEQVDHLTGPADRRFRRVLNQGDVNIAMATHKLETTEADIVYDVHGPLPTADGRPPLFMIAQPMDASGFSTLVSHFPDRTVITYDPRGLGRSVRKDGRVDNSPTVQAGDVHAVIGALGVGPVEMFASSGGAVTALALVAAYPNDVTTLVAHEPPLIPVLPDAEAAERARVGFRDAYEARGSGAGMAAFIAMTSWRGEFTDDYFATPAPDPAQFGMMTEDDGSRDDPLLSDRSSAITGYRPDFDALSAAPTRIVIAVGEESMDTFTGRTSVATAELLGQQATVFPSHHGGFMGGEFGYAGQPEAFARKLRDVLHH